MPYILSRKKRKGKTVYCAKSKRTGKTYCSTTKRKRAKMMKMHERYSAMRRKK